MKRLELVKVYPNSPEIGTIAEKVNGGFRILNKEGEVTGFTCGEDSFEDWSEFWKDADRDKRTMLERMQDFLDTEEGQQSLENFGKKLEKEELQGERDYERFCKMVEHTGLEALIEKLETKYDSDKYVHREYKLGYQPREDLKYLLATYFEKNGEETEGLNDFMEVSYKIGNYVVGIMYGQGSYVKIQKL
jgi:hypothetical protein